jgi:hypothetical protein
MNPLNPDCPHKNSLTEASTQHVLDNKQAVIGYQLIAKVSCVDCGVPFHFPNLPVCGEVAKTVSAKNNGTTLVVPMNVGVADYSKN